MSRKRISVIFVIFCYLSQAYSSDAEAEDIPTYNCQVYDEGSRCDLTNIKVTAKQPNFKITTKNPEKITEISITASKIPVLTNSICNTFPSLMRIHVEAGVKKIRKNTFEKCTNVLEINLANNKIKKLHQDTFRTNTQLFSLSFDNNLLTQLPDGIFNQLKDLQFLHLQNNYLTEFDTNLLIRNKNLALLYIFSNNLTDFDLEKLLRNVQNIDTIYANNNDFSCERVRELTVFAEKVKFDLSREYYGERKRDYKPRVIDEFLCKPENLKL